MDGYDKCWCMSFEHKKLLYGKQRLAVGGKDGDSDDSAADETDAEVPPTVGVKCKAISERGAANMEPVTYNSSSLAFWLDIARGYKFVNCYDLTPCDGLLMLACLMLQVSYAGVCYTDWHKDALRNKTIERVLEQMSTPGSILYDVNYVSYLKNKPGKSEDEPKKEDKKERKKEPKKEAKKEPKKEPKKEGKKRKRSSSSSSSSDSGSSA